VTTPNREPEWLTMVSDPLLAQSAVDRLTSTAHELVIEGDSYLLSATSESFRVCIELRSVHWVATVEAA